MARRRPTYEIHYALYVDGAKTKVELVGSSKADAYEMLADQWYLYRKDDVPHKRRCKLQELERVRWG